MKLLLVEDDKILGENLQELLEAEGYVVDRVITGQEGSNKAIVNEYDAIILDWMLGDIDGDEVCKNIRNKEIKTPIIFLTAKDQIEDKINGLDIGADDYMVKPFEIEELLARLRTLIRRNYNKTLQTVISIGQLSIDTSKSEVSIKNQTVDLSPKAYALLEYLALNKEAVVSRADIIEHLWDDNVDLFSNVIDVHIKNIRKAFKKFNADFQIKTVKGKGYMLCKK